MSTKALKSDKSPVCPDGCPLKLAGSSGLVTIALDEYQALLRARVDANKRDFSIRQLKRPSRSTVERNPEVCMFITARLGIIPVGQIHAECRKQFGRSLTPSSRSIYRYWKTLRINVRTGQISAAI